jgi:hypothetical protein
MTVIALSTFITQVENLIVDTANTELSDINLNQTAKQALMDYSFIKPNEVTEDETGDGGNYYLISGLAEWSDEFSRILAIQFPAPTVSSDEVPVYLEPEDWDEKYFDGSTQYIFLPNHAPSASEAFRVTYTAPYAWSSTSGTTTAISQVGHGFSVDDPVFLNASSSWVSTESLDLMATHKITAVADADNATATGLTVNIPEMDYFAICYRAACLACREIATKFSRTTDSTILADSVNHTSRAAEFAERAKVYCKNFSEHMGIRIGDDGKAGVKAYAEFVDWDTMPGWPRGREFIFHSSHTR